MDAVKQWFTQQITAHGLTIDALQWEQFETYYRELVSWNEKMNLTGITEREQVYEKHFFDSLSLSFFVPMETVTSMADIGSGAGFPSVPLKIMFPHLKLTIVDSLNKRIQFLQHVTQTLQLQHVQCVHGRAEDIARTAACRDQFDLVTARAVARLNVLNEFCLPFVKVGGTFVAMKGQDPAEELEEASYSLRQLRAEWVRTEHMMLPAEQSARHMVIVRKTGPTPAKYPRKAGTPLKQPLRG